MTESDIENQIVETLKHPGNKETENDVAILDRDINSGNQINETKSNLGELRDIFLEKGTNGEYTYKLDVTNNYLRETSTSIKSIKEALFNNRKKIITAVQISLCKAGYLPEQQIDGKWGPITRGAVAKFQRENGLGKQKNPGYLNVNTLNKLIEVSSKKEAEKQKKNSETQEKKRSSRRQINVPTPDNRIIEKTDNTRVAKVPVFMGKNRSDLKGVINQSKPEKIEKEKKGGTMEDIRLDITQKVGNFRPWHNGDSRFKFYNNDNNPNGNLPDQITICGEVYKYNGEGSDLNGLGFEETPDGLAFQLGTYTNGHIEEGFRFYFDGEREVGKFDFVGDLENGVRINADGSQHKVENYQEVD